MVVRKRWSVSPFPFSSVTFSSPSQHPSIALSYFTSDALWQVRKFCTLQVSISPTFYGRLFCTKVLQEAFLYIHFRFEHILAQEYQRKCAHKMVVKLTPGFPTALFLSCSSVTHNSSFHCNWFHIRQGFSNFFALCHIKLVN